LALWTDTLTARASPAGWHNARKGRRIKMKLQDWIIVGQKLRAPDDIRRLKARGIFLPTAYVDGGYHFTARDAEVVEVHDGFAVLEFIDVPGHTYDYAPSELEHFSRCY
jgi:hypothetical protein